MVSGAALNTLEVLERIPGVTVNSNGDISLNGRAGVLVMIDGRATYMSAQDLSSYLKSIPSANLDKIELIDNPSSKYDASGNAIINIKMRKNRDAGLTGNITSGFSQGKYFRSNNSVNLNYNLKKLNVFSNIGFSTAKEYSNDDFERKFFNTSRELTSSLLLENNSISSNRNINIYSGVDYVLTSKSTVGAIFSYNEGSRDLDFGFMSRNFVNGTQPGNIGTGTTDADDRRKNIVSI